MDCRLELGKVLELYIAPVGTSGVRESVEEVTLLADCGIEGDKFAGKDALRSIMIIGHNSYELAKEQGIELPSVALGENILLDFDPHSLPFGTGLLIGSAVIKITKGCTLCSHLTQYDNRLPKLVKNCRGIYAKVLKQGIIRKGDCVTTFNEG